MHPPISVHGVDELSHLRNLLQALISSPRGRIRGWAHGRRLTPNQPSGRRGTPVAESPMTAPAASGVGVGDTFAVAQITA